MFGLQNSKLFNTLTAEQLDALGKFCVQRKFVAGQEIFREGDAGDGLYVLTSGSVQISALVTPSERQVLTRIKPGDFFGEMAVLDGEPRSASATAEEQSICVFIPRNELLSMVEGSPALAVRLVREFSLRLRDFNRQYLHEVLQAERLTMVGRFARTIVHDFKNPLNVINLAAELIDMESIPSAMRKTATDRIRKQVDRLNNMISELLEFTRGPQRDLVLAPFPFAEYTTRLLDEFRPELSDKGTELIVRNPPPEVAVLLDPKRMLHVFSNLLHNAVDAMVGGDGKIFVSFRLEADQVITEIEDTGNGIAPEIAGRLFQPFATFGKAKGSGLGLSICKKVIDDHRGWIRASSPPGRGALFSFGLPIVKTSGRAFFNRASP